MSYATRQAIFGIRGRGGKLQSHKMETITHQVNLKVVHLISLSQHVI
jgi:hypothetical protein